MQTRHGIHENSTRGILKTSSTIAGIYDKHAVDHNNTGGKVTKRHQPCSRIQVSTYLVGSQIGGRFNIKI